MTTPATSRSAPSRTASGESHRDAGSAPGSQAVDRAAWLLAAVVESARPRSFTSLVDEFGLAKSTTSRLLQALERNRLVQRDRSGNFRAGALFSGYAAREQTARDLVELVHPMMERLAEETGETVNFSVPRGDGIVQVAQIDSRYLLGATNWVGVDVPAHCSALGKVLYAYGRLRLPRGPLERRTPSTITSTQRLERELVEVRRRGWAVVWEELEVGLVSIAAPIRAADGIVGAVSVSAPTARLPRSRLPAVAGLLSGLTGGVSGQLGFAGTASDDAAGPVPAETPRPAPGAARFGDDPDEPSESGTSTGNASTGSASTGSASTGSASTGGTSTGGTSTGTSSRLGEPSQPRRGGTA